MLKKIIIGIIVILTLTVLGLVWNLGRNQKPPQEAVDTLKQALNFQQSSSSSQSTTNSQFSNFSQLNNSSQNSSSTINSVNSASSSFSNFQSIISSNSSISLNQNNSTQNSFVSGFTSGITITKQIYNSLAENKILTLPNKNEIYDVPINTIKPILPTILPSLIARQNLEKKSFLWLYNPDTGRLEMFGQGMEKIIPFRQNGQNYNLIMMGDMTGYGKVFWTNENFENPQQILINNGDNIVKIETTDNPNLIQIETNISQKRPIPNTKYTLNLEKLISGEKDYYKLAQ